MTDEVGGLKKAVLWDGLEEGQVRCGLCRHRCTIAEGKVGRCGVRKNVGGVLYSLSYDKVISANPDPIEKKPLYHFQPGSWSFSIATMGCNFQCAFCQNWQISQGVRETGRIEGEAIRPERIVEAAVRSRCRSIAYTYTEPTVFMELCADCGRLAKERGLTNVFVSNGYMTHEAIDFAAEWLDGINVDLKAFNEEYYKRLCKARLKPVLDTIEYIAKQTNIWMEITTLVVPGENDSEQELRRVAEFIVDKAGPDVPWHISRFYPQYRYLGERPTDVRVLERAEAIGREVGLRYVYVGNVPGARSANTFCYQCGSVLIQRVGYQVGINRIKDGKCPECGAKIAGFEISG